MRLGLLLSSILGLDRGPIGMDGALTTADVPQKFLGNLGFVGHVPIMTLQVDPRITYALYVPEDHYNPDPEGKGPNNSTAGKLPLLVYIHATGRSILAIYDELAAFADETPCAIVAPVFPVGVDGPNDVDSYKVLRSESLRSDLGLLSVIDQVGYRWPGIETSKVALVGFSGGGQYAQRFLYLYPEKLAVASVGAPGIPTFIDNEQDWPHGIADAETLFNRTISTEAIGEVPIQIIVGNEDTDLGDPEFYEWQKEVLGDDGGMSSINETRLESAKKLHAHWEEAGIASQLDIVDGVGHEESGVRETVLKFLQPHIQKMA